jgi:uncharacterized protein (DUF934 family)
VSIGVAPQSARIWTPEGFRADDPWRLHEAESEGPLPDGHVILPLGRLQRLEEAERKAARGRLGVLLMPAEPVEAIAPVLPELALVALAFPAFNDGRSFSKAALLVERYAFAGDIRAMGEVLIDQIPLMLRAGFRSFLVSHPVALRRLAEGRIDTLPHHYQPASCGEEVAERFAWRRLKRAG